MDTIGLDLHKRESQLCMGHDNGQRDDRREMAGASALREPTCRSVSAARPC